MLFSLIMGFFGITEIFKFLSLRDFEIILTLIAAAANNNVDSISKLIKLGAKIEAKDDNGVKALVIAVVMNNVDSISKLIKLRAKIEAKAEYGRTVLIEAAVYNNVD